MIWLWLSAATMATTALIHSLFGEKDLIRPLLGIDEGILKIEIERKTIRLAWHLTSMLMLVSAALVVWPDTPRSLILLTGSAWLAVGVGAAIYTKGRHLAGPIFIAAGALAWVGAGA